MSGERNPLQLVTMELAERRRYAVVVVQCCQAVQGILQNAGLPPSSLIDVAAALLDGVLQMYPEVTRDQLSQALNAALTESRFRSEGD